MKKNYTIFSEFFTPCLALVVFLVFTQFTFSQGDLNIDQEECDYGTEDDFVNYPDLPADLVALTNCFNISLIGDKTLEVGADAVFSIDNIDNVNYQWQQKFSADGNWIPVGRNQATFTLENTMLSDSNSQIRVVIKPTSANDENCKISISNTARLIVSPKIIKQPEDQIVCSGNLVSFAVAVQGENLSYQWQRNDGGNSNNFFDVPNNDTFKNSKTATLKVVAKTWLNTKKFRVIITDANDNSITSSAALLNVNESPQGINTQPSNKVVCESQDVSFQTYTSNDQRQWQVSEDNGATWNDLSNNEFYQNVTSERLDVLTAPADFNNNLYRIKLYNTSCRVYSNPAKLQVDANPIQQQPQDATAPFGEDAFIEAGVSGNNLSFQWQTYSSNWYDIDNGEHYGGVNTNRLRLITVGYYPKYGSRYRLLVTNENGCVSISEVAFLNIANDSCKTSNTWSGEANTNWNNTANWSCNTLPTLETNVLIPENLASGNYPEITAGNNAFAKELRIENGASVIVNENWLRIAGDLTNSGVLTTENGSVSFEGASAQSIPNAAFANNRIQNLRINNTLGVISEAIIEVTGTLNVAEGNFDTGNELTLISNQIQTALIDGSGNGEVLGLVSMQRYLDKAFGYKYFSAPFQNSVVGDFAPYMDFQDPISEFPNFYRYEENRNVNINDTIQDATGWEVYTNTASNLNIAEGYALNFGTSNAAQTIELIGEVNNGPVPTRQLSNNHHEYTRGFHLVGNPYPSPIDWDATQGWTKNNIDDGIYFFTASDTSQYTGTYTAYVNNISTGDPLVDGRSSNIIPSMQGFFVKVSDSDTQDLVTGSFGMDNDVRVTNFDQQFLRSQAADLKSLIRLEAGFAAANHKDPMVIYFSSYATQNFEKEMDAHKLMNTNPAVPSFYNITQNKKELAINAIPFPETKSYKKIPLGIKANQSGKMTINLASVENLSSNFNIYLIDHEKSKGQNLRNDPEYTFNIKAGTHNSRFELMFSEEKITSPAIAFNEPFDVKVEDGNVVVSLNLEENQQGILRASTITGQILQIKEAGGKDRVVFKGITSDGVYIINLQLGKTMHAKKVLFKK